MSSLSFASTFASTARRVQMEVLVAATAWAMGYACSYLPVQADNGVLPRWVCPEANFGEDLVQRLSSKARIHWPGSESFNTSTTRWSTLDAPNITITIEVA